ncbi:MAG: universal stress protein [Halobacteriales archaeon]
MRNARILSIALHNPRDETDPTARAAQNLDNMFALLDEAGNYDPDFICFPEACLHHAARNDGLLEEIAEPIPGPATDAVAEKARAEGVEVRTHVEQRSPHEAVLEYAEENGVDLIVVGSRGKSEKRLRDRLLGGVSTKVVYLSDVPVLTVR